MHACMIRASVSLRFAKYKHETKNRLLDAVVYFKFPGCMGTAKYGPRGGPSTFCPLHKRAGMFTTRDGKLLVATRDGRGGFSKGFSVLLSKSRPLPCSVETTVEK